MLRLGLGNKVGSTTRNVLSPETIEDGVGTFRKGGVAPLW
jgi:hypothetical protein